MQNAPLALTRFWTRVAIKGLLLFVFCNFAFAFTDLSYGKFTLYNHLFAGRLRLPYSDQPSESYNVTLTNLDAMFASHILAGEPKSPNEYRVLLIGDSATWGYLLLPDQTLAASLNRQKLYTPDGKQVVFYNLGYPVMSLLKDVLLLERGIEYQPDLVLWLITLESFPKQKQLYSPLLEQNQSEVIRLLERLDLKESISSPQPSPPTLWQRSLIGQRKALADWLRYQLYGFLWTATQIDHVIPEIISQKQVDLSAEVEFYGQYHPKLDPDFLSFSVIEAAYRLVSPTPIILINEPMFISSGLNSHVRYNFYYPRWAYDDYRATLASFCQKENLTCWDIWDQISPEEFTNTAIHMTPQGTEQTAQWIATALKNWFYNQ
ncbi:MAG: hypothetical protein ANABAC_0511 [Anaerolineae bacterium]|jgi:hypothetical protein|nr:MAG: hypothetical protein ANABAC_0511 [Anaerolineae bacterium]